LASAADKAGLDVSGEMFDRFRELLSAHGEEIAEAMADAGWDADQIDWKQISEHLQESWSELATAVVTRGIPKALDPLNPTDEERKAIEDALLIDNPYLVPWLEKHGAELVKEITAQTRAGLSELLQQAHDEGATVAEVKERIKDRVGMLDADVATVAAWQQELIDDGMDEADAADEAAVYADELLGNRAENIARTEIAFAESNGTLATWLAAADAGLTLPGTVKVWLAGEDEMRTCDICKHLGTKYREDGIPLDEEFELPDGTTVPCPPAHPSCRCDMGMITRVEKAMPQGTGLAGAEAEQWQAVYDECVGAGDDEETAAKKAWGAVKGSEGAEPVAKTVRTSMICKLQKFDDEKQIVFGWLSVAKDEQGNSIVDHQGHEIAPEILEDAVYEFNLESRAGGDCHEKIVSRLVESVMLTKEKQAAIGIPPGCVPEGWWCGFKVDDAASWKKIKSGEHEMMSIAGDGLLEEVE